MKLSIRIPLLIGAVVLITSASIGFTALQISSNTLEATILNAIGAENGANAELLSSILKGQIDIIGEIANRARTRTMNWETVRPSLTADITRIGALDMALIFPDGIAHYVLDNSTLDLHDRDYFIRAMAGEKKIEVVFSRAISKTVVMFAAPIFQSDEKDAPVAGVLVARRDGAQTLSEVVVNLKSSMKSGYSYLVDRTGTIIAHPNTDLVTNQFNPMKEVEGNPSLKPLAHLFEAALKEKNGISRYVYDGKNLLGHYSEVPGHSWLLFSTIEKSDVDSQLTHMRFIVFAIGALFIIAGLIIAFFIGRSIAKPVVSMAGTLEEVGKGDLTRRINLFSKDEIGDLSGHFNSTLENIKDLILMIKKESEALSGIGAALASNSTENATAVKEIVSAIQTIQGRVANQSSSVTQTKVTIEQISGSIDKLNEQVENQSSSVSQSSSAIEEMLANIQSVTQTLVKNAGNVKELMDASEVGREGLQGVAADIQEIARESEGLLEINSVMKNISSQTNLLSMNAAIEAAHAGEAGRGFAVVADEIRKLAENSGEQSKTISTVLKKIKGSIDKITLSTGYVLDKFAAIDDGVKTVSEQEENILDAMEKQGTGSQKILEAIGQLNEITRQVQDGSGRMLDGSREITGESKILENVTDEITGGMAEISKGADRIRVAVNEVNKISGQNKEIIADLEVAVSRFKV